MMGKVGDANVKLYKLVCTWCGRRRMENVLD